MRKKTLLPSMRGKLLLAFSLVLLPACVAVAEDVLRMHLTDGRTMTFALADKPEITASTDSMTVTLASAAVAFAHSDVVYLDYGDDGKAPVGIGSPTADSGSAPDVRFGSESLRVSGLEPGCKLLLLNAGGQLVATFKADTDGGAEVSLSGISKGVYILSDGNKMNVKFAKH